MTDIEIRRDRHVGCITLKRPDALNALTYDMVLKIGDALDDWRASDISLVIIGAEGDRAFCAGGDISEMYATGKAGDFEYGRQFWRDEYRLNAKLFEYPKPVVSFLQGFTMGGGVGIGCHGSHRIVGDSSVIAMPECSIGLVPDVGGSLMLALAPGRVGEYLATTSTRMSAADAIFAGFADHYIPETQWSSLKEALSETGDLQNIGQASARPGQSALSDQQAQIDTHFSGEDLGDVVRSLATEQTSFTEAALKALHRNAPLATSCALQITRRLRSANSIRTALDMEFRYTYRSMDQGDFLEGIRAAIIDRDKNPQWAHDGPDKVPAVDVSNMIAPLKDAALNWKDV